ncbi:rhomboid family intramembrane serine protease [Planctomicrobium sp. SH661]|uniref:rhomboid family intramembrane serine protease n=1 Tax=Planctomicrobium sp. SH661 TaxID=3448124 RepID=UPI003F5B1DE6
MFPLRDNVPTHITPFVNYAIIVACILVFAAQLQEKPGEPSLVERYGLIPARVLHPDAKVEITVEARQVQTLDGPKLELTKRPAAPAAVPQWMTFLTCVFLHGSVMHIAGNMWFLFIFGDNIEDRFGHVGYALFYLFCGAAASLVHYVSNTHSALPTIGASGAIAGVMGAYFVWYSHSQVQALIPLGVFTQIINVPAPIFLGIWFLLQLFSTIGFAGGTESTGVAWWAHIGGFAVGAILALILGKAPLLSPKVNDRFSGPQRAGIFSVPRMR